MEAYARKNNCLFALTRSVQGRVDWSDFFCGITPEYPTYPTVLGLGLGLGPQLGLGLGLGVCVGYIGVIPFFIIFFFQICI